MLQSFAPKIAFFENFNTTNTQQLESGIPVRIFNIIVTYNAVTPTFNQTMSIQNGEGTTILTAQLGSGTNQFSRIFSLRTQFVADKGIQFNSTSSELSVAVFYSHEGI